MKTLSIAIPTHNRAHFLKEELDILLPQVLTRKEEIEIIISDNVSTDDTESMMHKYMEIYGDVLFYFRQSVPLDFEDNFDFVIEHSLGEYIYLLGDDDLHSPDFLSVLFRLMDKDYSIIHFNRLVGDEKCSNNSLFDINYEVLEDVCSSSDFIRKLTWKPNFMSSLVFKRECWINGGKLLSEGFYGYRFLGQVYLGATTLSNNCCYYYMPMLIMRNPNRTFAKKFPLFFFVGLSNIFKAVDEYIPGVLDIWLYNLHNNKVAHYMHLLSIIQIDKRFYQSKSKEFMPYLCRRQKVAYKLLTSSISNSFLRKLYNFIVKVLYKG